MSSVILCVRGHVEYHNKIVHESLFWVEMNFNMVMIQMVAFKISQII